jgi:hypothetical protein
MTLITATETFDEELLDPELSEDMAELIEWLNANMQNIVSALNGGISDQNTSIQSLEVKATSGVKQFIRIEGDVSHVEVSRVISQPDTQTTITGYNWWPATGGFEFLVNWENGSNTYNVQLRVHFNV